MGLFTPKYPTSDTPGAGNGSRKRRSPRQEAYGRMYAVRDAAEAIKREQANAWLDGKRPIGDPAADHDAAYSMVEQI
ncbi:hypothetical protein KUM39_27980, partial [Streptomyces sp. J2-1]|uniref:hypothetical protein n=1 Tax=Streptomyces corallincola TaxID=2851888 RepID=UPI001C387571